MEETGAAHAGAWVKWCMKLGSLAPRKENKAREQLTSSNINA